MGSSIEASATLEGFEQILSTKKLFGRVSFMMKFMANCWFIQKFVGYSSYNLRLLTNGYTSNLSLANTVILGKLIMCASALNFLKSISGPIQCLSPGPYTAEVSTAPVDFLCRKPYYKNKDIIINLF